jgi:hypothetical protein
LIHERHFTVAEATALLDQLKPLLRELRAARDQLTDTDVHALLAEAAPTNGGGAPGRQVGVAFMAVRRILLAIQDAEVVVRDIERGLVDFPAIRDGEEVYLCWKLVEDEIAWWHEIDAGYRGRQPLD